MESHKVLPVIPMRDVVVFPRMMVPFIVGRESSIRALEHASRNDKFVFVATQRDATVETPSAANLHTMGCVAVVAEAVKLPDGTAKVLIHSAGRAKVLEWNEAHGFLAATVTDVVPPVELDVHTALISRVISMFEKYAELTHHPRFKAVISAVRSDDPDRVSDTIAFHLPVAVEEKQQLLELLSPRERLTRLKEILRREVGRTSPSPENDRARELLRITLKDALKASRFSGAIFNRAVEVVSRPLPAHGVSMFAFRGLSNAGTTRMRQLLKRHELVVDVAQEALQVLIKVLDEEEDDQMTQSLEGILSLIRQIGTHAAAEGTMFGVNPDTSK